MNPRTQTEADLSKFSLHWELNALANSSVCMSTPGMQPLVTIMTSKAFQSNVGDPVKKQIKRRLRSEWYHRVAMQDLCRQPVELIAKTFWIQLDPANHHTTRFLVPDIRQPTWFHDLRTICQSTLVSHRHNAGDLGAPLIELVDLVDFASKRSLRKLSMRELYAYKGLVVPQFSMPVGYYEYATPPFSAVGATMTPGRQSVAFSGAHSAWLMSQQSPISENQRVHCTHSPTDSQNELECSLHVGPKFSKSNRGRGMAKMTSSAKPFKSKAKKRGKSKTKTPKKSSRSPSSKSKAGRGKKKDKPASKNKPTTSSSSSKRSAKTRSLSPKLPKISKQTVAKNKERLKRASRKAEAFKQTGLQTIQLGTAKTKEMLRQRKEAIREQKRQKAEWKELEMNRLRQSRDLEWQNREAMLQQQRAGMSNNWSTQFASSPSPPPPSMMQVQPVAPTMMANAPPSVYVLSSPQPSPVLQQPLGEMGEDEQGTAPVPIASPMGKRKGRVFFYPSLVHPVLRCQRAAEATYQCYQQPYPLMHTRTTCSVASAPIPVSTYRDITMRACSGGRSIVLDGCNDGVSFSNAVLVGAKPGSDPHAHILPSAITSTIACSDCLSQQGRAPIIGAQFTTRRETTRHRNGATTTSLITTSASTVPLLPSASTEVTLPMPDSSATGGDGGNTGANGQTKGKKHVLCVMHGEMGECVLAPPHYHPDIIQKLQLFYDLVWESIIENLPRVLKHFSNLDQDLELFFCPPSLNPHAHTGSGHGDSSSSNGTNGTGTALAGVDAERAEPTNFEAYLTSSNFMKSLADRLRAHASHETIHDLRAQPSQFVRPDQFVYEGQFVGDDGISEGSKGKKDKAPALTSVYAFLFHIITQEIDYAGAGLGSLPDFLHMLVPGNDIKLLVTAVAVMVPFLVERLAYLIMHPNVHDNLTKIKRGIASLKKELKTQRKLLKVVETNIAATYRQGALDKGSGVLLTDEVILSKSLADIVKEVAPVFIPMLQNAYKERTEISVTMDTLQSKLKQRVALEEEEYLFFLKTMVATHKPNHTEFANYFLALRYNHTFLHYLDTVAVPSMIEICHTQIVDAHNNERAKNDQSVHDNNRNNHNHQVEVTVNEEGETGGRIGAGMGKAPSAATRLDVAMGRNTMNAPTIVHGSSLFITRPGTCEDMYMQAQEPQTFADLPSDKEVKQALQAILKRNDAVDDLVAAGKLAETYESTYLYPYLGGATGGLTTHMLPEANPWAQPCYIEENNIVHAGQIGTAECNDLGPLLNRVAHVMSHSQKS